MSEAIPLHDDRRPRPRGSMSAYWRVAGAYWKGPTSVQAWSLTLISLVLVIGNVVVQYGINLWNRSFFNALQQRDQSFVYQAIAIFLARAFAAAIVAVLQLVFRMRLQILWRQWLIRRLVGQWLSEQRFYRLSIAAPDLDAPEFRIAEDAKVATEPVVDFGYGITNAVLTAAVFFGVLWSASGSADFFGWRITGFMVYAAIVYSIVMSASMVLFGRALINRIEQRNRDEAQLRYEMGRVRENAESIGGCEGALGPIAAIYVIEAKATFAPAAERVQSACGPAPLLDTFFAWAEVTVTRLAAKSALAVAFRYRINRRAALPLRHGRSVGSRQQWPKTPCESSTGTKE